MASYQKYIITGASTLLLPLAKRLFQKLVDKFTGESEDEYASEDRASGPTLEPSNVRPK